MDSISNELTCINVSSLKIISGDEKIEFDNSTYSKEVTPYIESLTADELSSNQFGAVFRQCAPYIAMHRSSVVVIHIGSHVFADRETFDGIIDDISILHLLGVYIVIVAGVRNQLNAKILKSGNEPLYRNGMLYL